MISGPAKEQLRKLIQELGFHRVGFTDAEELFEESAYLQERGAGPFEPEILPPRTDPKLLLPRARSVIAVALNYHHPDPPSPPGVRGRLSKYCRGLDYHELMLERLELLAHQLEEKHGAESLAYVDTGPPLERAFAQKAGLGRLGKNTNLIVPKLGSWVFLGVLITSLLVEPDRPADYAICGSCRLCLDACPTQCLDEWVLDSENCVGYLNQKHAEIPEKHREAMGDWLFGCDVCQEVCPHNVKSPVGEQAFEALPKPGAFPELWQMVQMTSQQFEEWFRPTAADWRGPQAIRRNAYVALGNSQDEKAVDQLISCFPQGDTELEEHAQWAARRLSERFPWRAECLSSLG